VLVLTRDDAIPVLTRIIVAPITRTVRGIPTELHLDADDGLRTECAASFDNLLPISRHLLTGRVAALNPARRVEMCAALAALADC
jgi:mRNA interferase MazF